MRSQPLPEAEEYRVNLGSFCSPAKAPFGAFVIPYKSSLLAVIVASGEDDHHMPEGQWDHVSVSLKNRCPNWEEMCFVKSLFFEDHETVIQYHPRKSAYVNIHPYCLHMWRPTHFEIPLPPVGAV